MIDLLGGAPAVEISPVAGREGTAGTSAAGDRVLSGPRGWNTTFQQVPVRRVRGDQVARVESRYL